MDLKEKGNPAIVGKIGLKSNGSLKNNTDKKYNWNLIGLIQKSLSIHHILEIKSVMIKVEQQLRDP